MSVRARSWLPDPYPAPTTSPAERPARCLVGAFSLLSTNTRANQEMCTFGGPRWKGLSTNSSCQLERAEKRAEKGLEWRASALDWGSDRESGEKQDDCKMFYI